MMSESRRDLILKVLFTAVVLAAWIYAGLALSMDLPRQAQPYFSFLWGALAGAWIWWGYHK
jgi:lipopolysaccharide export LptBFGC system permease protein LptF